MEATGSALTQDNSRSFFMLLRSAADIVEAADLETLLDELIMTAVVTTGAKYGALGVLGDSGHLSEFHHKGMSDELAARIGHLPVGKGVLGTLIRKPEPLRIPELSDHPDSVGFPPGHPPMGAFLGVPIAVGETVFGNLYLTDKPGGFTEEDEAAVLGLAVLAGSAVNTARLNERLNRLAVVEERERIARDIHDSIIQDLFGMGLGLQGMSAQIDPPLNERLRESVVRIDELIGRLRSLIFDLVHTEPNEPSARSSLAKLLEQLAAPFPTSVRLNMEVEHLADKRLLEDVRHIVKEATSNALRHAGADSVIVDIDRFKDQMVISVTDDGNGFKPDSVARGLGLDNLAARVERLGGTFGIRSGTDVGTVVEVTIPL